MAIKARYKGDGSEFLNGIPARNLDEDEYAALDADQKRDVRQSGLYEVRPDDEIHPAKAEDKKGGNT